MQASVYGTQGILSELSRALHLESGIVGECGLLAGDDCFAARVNAFPLAVFLFRNFL